MDIPDEKKRELVQKAQGTKHQKEQMLERILGTTDIFDPEPVEEEIKKREAKGKTREETLLKYWRKWISEHMKTLPKRKPSTKSKSNEPIRIPLLPEGSAEVDIPEFYAVEKKRNRKNKKTGAIKTETSYKIVNPLTQERNIATRDGAKPIKIVRKEVDKVSAVPLVSESIPLSKFSATDQRLVKAFNDARKEYDEDGIHPKNRRDKSAFQVKERGRPEVLPKNIIHHMANGTSKASEKLRRALAGHREEEEKEEREDLQEEKEGEVGDFGDDRGDDGGDAPDAPRRRGRPRKYRTPEEAREAKTKATVASNRRRAIEREQERQRAERERAVNASRQESRHNTRQRRGLGIMSSAKKLVKDLSAKVSATASVLANGVSDYSPQIRALLTKYGDKKVVKIVIGRTPVQSAISTAINAVSFGQFNKNMKKTGYDAIYHLFLELTLEGNIPIRLEKNEVITMTEGHPPKDKMEKDESVVVQTPVSLKELLDNAKQKEGDRFFKYDSANNNCQTFVYNVLSASNLLTPQAEAFVKQDTKALFENATLTRKIAHNITELGAKANVLMKGAGTGDGIDNPELYEKAKKIADEKYKKPSAYKSGFIVKTYKEMGGTYSGKKTNKGIGRWFKEDWKDVGHQEYPVYRPTKRVSKDTPLTPQEIDPSHLKEQIALKQEIKGDSNLPPFQGKGVEDYVVQSVIFPHSYGIPEARKWLKTNGYKSPKVDVEKNTIRFRQMTPSAVKKQGFTEYRNKEIGDGILLCLVYKKKISDKDMPKFAKGSQEAKDYMAKLRASRGKKGGSVEGEPILQMGGGLYAGKGLYAGGGLYAGKGLYAGGGASACVEAEDSSSSDEEPEGRGIPTKVIIHHHHHYDGSHMEGGNALKKFGKELGKDALQAVAKKAIPIATTTAGAYLGGLTGNPVAGAKLGSMAGNKLAGMADKKIEGLGVKPHMVKGSQEAKDHMRRLREMRKSKC